MIENIQMDTFAIGDVFKLYYDEEQFVELVLERIDKGRFPVPEFCRTPFTLTFKLSKDVYLEPGTHTLAQAKVGRVDININPVLPPNGQMEAFHFYEAVFS